MVMFQFQFKVVKIAISLLKVSHIRVMRVRCSLCDAGSFFCSDMRIHLMFRHCEKLCLATDFVLPGDTVPCMDKKKVEQLLSLSLFGSFDDYL